MIHVLNRDTKQSLHLSGFSAILSDLAFAADHSRVILATIDVEGRLQVLEIKESEDQFRTLLSTKLLSTQIRWESSDPGESKYALTWKPIVPGSDNEFRYQIGISANSCHLCVLGLRDGYPDSPPAPLYPLGGKRGCVAFEPSVVGFKLSGRHQMICVADKTGVILLNYNSRDDGVPKEIEIDPRSIGCEVSGSWLIDYAGESDEKPSLNQLLLLGLNGNSQFELWDFQANVCLQSLSLSSSREEPLKPEFAVAIDPNGKFIAVGRKTYGKRTQLFLMILKWPEKDLPKVTTVCEYNVPVSLLSLQVSSKLDDPDDLCTLMVGGTFGIYGLIIPLKDPCKSVKKGFAPIRKRAENLAHIIYARETNCSLELERTPKEIVHLESLEESFFLSRKGKKEETNDSPVKEEILSPLKDEKEICLRDSTTSDAMCAPVQARPATPGVGLSNRRVFSRDLPPRKLLSSFEGSEVIFEEPEEEEKEEEGSSANVPKESLDPQARTPGGAYAINSLPDGLRSHGDSSDSGQCSAFEKEEEEDSKNDLKRFVVNGFKALDTKFERLESCITENYDCLNDRLLKLEEKMECGFAKHLEEMRDKLCDDFSLKIEPDLNSSADSDEHEKDTSDGVILESASRKKVLGYIAKQKFDKALALASAENDPSWPLVVCLRVRLPKIVDSLKTETLLKLLKCLTNNFGTMISPRMVCIEAIVLKINWTDNPHTRYLLCRLHAAINEYSLKGEESDTCRERMSRLSSIVKKQLREQEEDD